MYFSKILPTNQTCAQCHYALVFAYGCTMRQCKLQWH
ncbi:Uncharacterised protein [Vibrio cholerae]|nr:Uncharacterised protein [Vibrio cholerae]